jgi:hypothetical protein
LELVVRHKRALLEIHGIPREAEDPEAQEPEPRTHYGEERSSLRRRPLDLSPDVLGRLGAILNLGLNPLWKNFAGSSVLDRPQLASDDQHANLAPS